MTSGDHMFSNFYAILIYILEGHLDSVLVFTELEKGSRERRKESFLKMHILGSVELFNPLPALPRWGLIFSPENCVRLLWMENPAVIFLSNFNFMTTFRFYFTENPTHTPYTLYTLLVAHSSV